MKKSFVFLVAWLLILGLGGMAHATLITGYDIDNAVRSGYGGWSHSYDGTISEISPIDTSGWAGTLADYTGGGGTLNDDVIGTSPANTQLFATYYDPVITLYLDDIYAVENMTLYSFTGDNTIPGNITSVDLTIGGVMETFATTTYMGDQHEYIDIELGSSGLSDIATSQIILSGFQTDLNNYWHFMFSISEIDMTANPEGNQVPEPATMLLLGSGLLGLIGFGRKRMLG